MAYERCKNKILANCSIEHNYVAQIDLARNIKHTKLRASDPKARSSPRIVIADWVFLFDSALRTISRGMPGLTKATLNQSVP